jgi:hypothetical protein
VNIIYRLNYKKTSSGATQTIEPIKEILDSEQNVVATQVVTIQEFIDNVSETEQEAIYSEARSTLSETIGILFPEGSEPELSIRDTGLPITLGLGISTLMAIGLGLDRKRQRNN